MSIATFAKPWRQHLPANAWYTQGILGYNAQVKMLEYKAGDLGCVWDISGFHCTESCHTSFPDHIHN